MVHILFPFQLAEDIDKKSTKLFKDYLFHIPGRADFKYHKLKLAWVEATCQVFSKENNVPFIAFSALKKLTGPVTIYDPLDFDILDLFVKIFGDRLTVLGLKKSFMLEEGDLNNIYKKMVKHKDSHLSHKVFFDHVKDRFNILKGVASTDEENRESIRYLKGRKIEDAPLMFENKGALGTVCNEAIKTVNAKYPGYPGVADNLKHLPICKKDAVLYFAKFVKERLPMYGKLQDAIDNESIVLFHSHCSYLINVGLLTPRFVIDAVLLESKKSKIPLNSVEGFIRQVLGWRDFCHFIYHFWGRELKAKMIERKTGANLDMNAWYQGKTGITPIDTEIEKIRMWAWAHHIIRLMVFLNFMKLNDIKVYDIYKWFMTFVSLDAYEWVMVSNIMVMGYYDKRFMRRGYVSSSNYILKMSNYKKDGKWDITWNELYARYVKKNGRLG